jgi:ATP-dependent Zn protease
MTRALRGLAKLGKVQRDEGGIWRSLKAIEGDRLAKDAAEKRLRETAYHEAGHAVMGLAGQLSIGMATIVPNGNLLGHVVGVSENNSIGHVFKLGKRSYKKVTTDAEASLDPFGNPVRKREPSAEEHHSEVVMCIAGPMAHAELQGDCTKWSEHASNSDMSIARRHRRELGDAAKSWEEYEQETLRLVRKYWAMIEAVAAKLLKVNTLSGNDVGDICRRVVRRQHLKSQRRAAA